MAILKVAQMGHPILRRVADPIPVEAFGTEQLNQLITDLLETAIEYDGLGLAAPQVHCSVRLVVVCLDPIEGFVVWINPRVTAISDETITTPEGCLSIEGLRGEVTRPNAVEVRAIDQNGDAVQLELHGFSAVVAQHECDHLDGILYIDKVDTKTLAFLPEHNRYGQSRETE